MWQYWPVIPALLSLLSGTLYRRFSSTAKPGEEVKYSTDTQQWSLEENFLRRLRGLRCEWMNNPEMLAAKLRELLSQHRQVPDCVWGEALAYTSNPNYNAAELVSTLIDTTRWSIASRERAVSTVFKTGPKPRSLADIFPR